MTDRSRRTAHGSRIALAGASLLVGIAWFQPLWHIGLKAPQYPEGIGMYIWADKITGQNPQDLNSLNGLNHYIGMKAIVPESIPELRFMPAILGVLVVLGLVAAAAGRRRALFAWTGLFALVALAGLADFWRWGYDYGHDLDPTAAIRVPGMSYQPPLIGTKQLLNFQATSWPAVGGWALVIALTIGVALCLVEWRRKRRGALMAAALALAACGSPKPAEIAFGSAVCDHCHMTIAEQRFSAQLVTTRHRTRLFDDAGCLAAFVASGEVPREQIHSLWVSDYLEPGTLLPADSALFVRSDSLQTPMNSHVVAVGRRAAADSLARASSGVTLTWAEVLADTGHGAH